jgi:hypothetical protein
MDATRSNHDFLVEMVETAIAKGGHHHQFAGYSRLCAAR